jgi:phosphoribosylformimino-5-aminoimidazole carboxamide ribotide isomerase
VAIPIEVGGGVRSMERAQALIDSGVDRVVVGTAAIEDPLLLAELVADFPGKVVVALDHKSVLAEGRLQREVAVHGWEVGSGVSLEAAVRRLDALDLAALIVTDISRDGTLEGPDLIGLGVILSATGHGVIASGGVGTVRDLVTLNRVGSGERRIAGVIVGRALLSSAITLEEAIAACRA